jgi:hypothetical protein
MDYPDWINRCNMYDLFIFASGDQNIEIKKGQRCFLTDVCHSHYRIVSLAGLWIYTQRSSLDFGK